MLLLSIYQFIRWTSPNKDTNEEVVYIFEVNLLEGGIK